MCEGSVRLMQTCLFRSVFVWCTWAGDYHGWVGKFGGLRCVVLCCWLWAAWCGGMAWCVTCFVVVLSFRDVVGVGLAGLSTPFIVLRCFHFIGVCLS